MYKMIRQQQPSRRRLSVAGLQLIDDGGYAKSESNLDYFGCGESQTFTSPGYTERTRSTSCRYTDHSLSSSVCLSESGRVMVTSRLVKNQIPLPPPPLHYTEDDDENDPVIQETPRIIHSRRRRSMFESIPNSNTTSFLSSPYTPSKVVFVDQPRSNTLRRKSMIAYSSDMLEENSINQNSLWEDSSIQNNDFVSKKKSKFKRLKPKKLFGSSTSSFGVSSSSQVDFNYSVDVDDNTRRKKGLKKKTKKIARAIVQVPKTIVQSPQKILRSRRRHSLFAGSVNRSDGVSSSHHGPTPSNDEYPSYEHQTPSSRRRNSFVIVGSETTTNVCGPYSPSKSPQKNGSASHHRNNLLDGSGSVQTSTTPRINRRGSILGGSKQETKTKIGSATPQKQFRSSRRRRHSLLGGSPSRNSTNHDGSSAATIDPYELLTIERVKRSIPPYTRRMHLDATAKKVSHELACSGGDRCSPTDFYGNVGKGIDILMVHGKMMAQKGTEKANIISKRFHHIGIGLSTGPDDQVYVCQLFE